MLLNVAIAPPLGRLSSSYMNTHVRTDLCLSVNACDHMQHVFFGLYCAGLGAVSCIGSSLIVEWCAVCSVELQSSMLCDFDFHRLLCSFVVIVLVCDGLCLH